MNIGDKIKILRKDKKLTQREFGKLIGKSESSIKKYESGVTTIPLDILNQIAKVFDISLSEFICSDNDNTESIELFKRYLESKNHYINDIALIEEIENYISEYIKFKLFENSKLD